MDMVNAYCWLLLNRQDTDEELWMYQQIKQNMTSTSTSIEVHKTQYKIYTHGTMTLTKPTLSLSETYLQLLYI